MEGIREKTVKGFHSHKVSGGEEMKDLCELEQRVWRRRHTVYA
jgi:hypothetical protein